MKRRIFNLVAAVSMVLFIATVTLWIRSLSTADSILRETETPDTYRYLIFSSGGGRLSLLGGHLDGGFAPRISTAQASPLFFGWKHQVGPAAIVSLRRRSFEWETTKVTLGNRAAGETWDIVFPHWLAALLCLILPVLRLITWVRARRVPAEGLCRTCGYDLRATPDRCPECGTVPGEMGSAKSIV